MTASRGPDLHRRLEPQCLFDRALERGAASGGLGLLVGVLDEQLHHGRNKVRGRDDPADEQVRGLGDHLGQAQLPELLQVPLDKDREIVVARVIDPLEDPVLQEHP